MSENTWPNPDRPGVPLNPEKDGWHWLEDTVDGVETGHIEAVYYAVWDVPIWYRAGNKSPITKPKQWRYLGPCLTPAEAVALQAENAKLREALILARVAVSHACELSDRILYTQDLRRIDAALGEKG